MHQRYFQIILFIITLVAGIYTTSLANASADWFVDKYLSDPWIDPLLEVSTPRNCDALVLVLNSYGEVYTGKEKLGTFDATLGRFDEPATLTSKLTENIARLNERMHSCLARDVQPYCGPDALCLLTVEGVKSDALANLTKLLRAANVDFVRLIVRHRFRIESSVYRSAVQSTKPANFSTTGL